VLVHRARADAEDLPDVAIALGRSEPMQQRRARARSARVETGGATIGRAIFALRWRWATSVQPIAKTESCEAPHFQYHVSGVLRIRMDNGAEFDCRVGDVLLLPAGHDAWVVGDEAAVVIDFQGMLDYARSSNG
jgi:hypothetical protein